ncbi:MAG: bi-domain-containing oxidoreductase, partial [Rudaea sp.]
MKQVLQNFRSGRLRVADVPAPACQPGQVLVRTLYSVVSAGTERHSLQFARKNLLQKAQARPDLVRKVLNSVRTDGLTTAYRLALSRLDDWKPLGYSSAGRVLQVGAGVANISVGDLVACAGAGYANHAEVVSVPRNLAAAVPAGVDPRQAAFATLGAIALEGIHRANLSPGESVGVVGLGLLGQLTALILRQYNMPVLGIDVSARQVEKAGSLGILAVTNAGAQAAAKGFGEGRGLDAVIVTAAAAGSEPVRLAGELCRERGRVSAVGLVGMEIPRQLYYDKQLDFFVSRSYGPGRYDPQYEEKGKDYPLGYVRWTENRNLQEFLRLLAGGMDLSPLITHTFSIEDAEKVYAVVNSSATREYFLGILFQYPADAPVRTRVTFHSEPAPAMEGDVQVGVIGPGSFARATLLPALKKLPGVSIRGVCSATGRTAEAEARASGAAYCTSDYAEILNDPQINTVVISTRHNLHARLVVESLDRGKHVFVVKPLALTPAELCQVAAALRRHPDQLLMVGYNRRFSVYTRELQTALKSLPRPFQMHYRVNAGSIDPRRWVHDTVEGGGRIVGEVCHFVDLLQTFAGAAPVQVFAQGVRGATEVAGLDDNLAISLLFADGSAGNIVYTALGARSLAKERVEVFAGGRALVLDNWKA